MKAEELPEEGSVRLRLTIAPGARLYSNDFTLVNTARPAVPLEPR